MDLDGQTAQIKADFAIRRKLLIAIGDETRLAIQVVLRPGK